MKKISKYLFLAIAVVIAGCSDFLDLNTQQYSAISTDQAITNVADANAALIGVYDGLQGSSTYTSYYNSQMIYYGDVRGDDMQAAKAGNRTSTLYEMQYTKDSAPAIWGIPYNIIRRTNNLIKAINEGKVSDGTTAEVNVIKGQALAVRALVHFDLVRVYGKPFTMDNGASFGVPVVLEPTDPLSVPPRNSVSEVYNQVITDLTDAISLLETSAQPVLGKFNVWAAKALLVRVYLYQGNNSSALALAQDIIANSPYKLWTTQEYPDVWTQESTSEVIFEIVNFDSSDWGDREGIGYLMSENGYADMIVTTAFSDLLNQDPDDVRHSIVDKSKKSANINQYGEDKVWVNKFRGRTETQIPLANIPILRLSEVYLNAAEAAIKMGNNALAAEYIKVIATRANPATTEDISEATISLTRVLDERRKELVGEGHRFFDLMRNNLTVTRYTDENNRGRHYIIPEPASRQFDNTYFRAILPIPISEMNANPTMADQQNPGY